MLEASRLEDGTPRWSRDARTIARTVSQDRHRIGVSVGGCCLRFGWWSWCLRQCSHCFGVSTGVLYCGAHAVTIVAVGDEGAARVNWAVDEGCVPMVG